jgi:hypothetical protein
MTMIEKYVGAIVFEGPEAASGGLKVLDLAVEIFGAGVGDPMKHEVGQAFGMSREHVGDPGQRGDGLLESVGAPVVEEGACVGNRGLTPEGAKGLLALPDGGRVDGSCASFLKAKKPVLVNGGKIGQKEVAGALQTVVAPGEKLSLFLAPGLVDRIVQVLGDVETIVDKLSIWQHLAGSTHERCPHVGAHCLYVCSKMFGDSFRKCEFGTVLSSTFRHFEHSPRNQVGDNRHVVVSLLHALFINPDYLVDRSSRRASPRSTARCMIE